ncbi:MAG: UDP-N-acetylmuramoyl-tripeptide--D-alanyl-D-alanine ligase [Chloroflexota bacterium]|nr:UDP-N-acetylmuramoyl-tripeptide--D-alanyl-D-alanine ligase [Chloroflexota bacterium]
MSDAPSLLPTPGDPHLSGEELARIVRGDVLAKGSLAIRGGSVDSRRVVPGSCFFALPGERTDGQRFLLQAVRAGAAALVVRDVLDADRLTALRETAPVTIVSVPDALIALQAVARAWRQRFEPLVVGITGSLAKTSTKEQTAEVLSQRWSVLRNAGNENNEVGLPLTLLRLGPAHEAAVLEMGMYVAGEIRQLAEIARPSIGVVTAVRGTHLSRAGSLAAIEEGKAQLVEALPAEGTAVLNADDARVVSMRTRTPATVLTYGFDPSADVSADVLQSLGEAGMSFMLKTPAGSAPVVTTALGRHSVHNGLAAAAVGIAAGMDLPEIVRGLAGGFQAPHRTAFLRAGEWRILDDSYNAAPDSMFAALELLGTLGGRRIAVLGEMLELGDDADEAHRAVGRRSIGLADRLVTVGAGADAIAAGAREAGLGPAFIDRVADRQKALELLVSILRPGDAVLVKASRGVALDLLVDDLVAAGSDAVTA